MKIVSLVARLLLGAVFLFFGSNLLLNFLPKQPMPAGPAGEFFTAMAVTHYIQVVAVFQVVPGILLLINRYVPLGLALLAPVIFNILVIHTLMAPSGLPMAGLVTILWLLAAYRERAAFLPLLQQRVRD